jgi:hypothetical protein
MVEEIQRNLKLSTVCNKINPLKHEVHLNKIYVFSSNLKENILSLHYKDQPVLI